jgi:DNA-binding NtrC family response regulator
VARKVEPSVFVVDDEPNIGISLVAILALKGYRATAFTSPLKALEAARYGAPDILISDVVMPDLSGFDLAILMSDRFPQCKILLFSGQHSTSDLLEDAHRKGHHFRLLQKPVHPRTMLEEVAIMSQSGQELPFMA